MAIPQKYVLKIMRNFTQAGIVRRYSGTFGGFELIRREDLSLYDIIALTEPTTRINRCMENDCYCSRHAVPFCPVRKVYLRLQNRIESLLSSVLVEDLVHPDSPKPAEKTAEQTEN